MRILLLSVLLTLTTSSSVNAAETPPGPVSTMQAPPAKADPSQQIICRHQEETGTRLGGKKVCHTQAQWETIDAENKSRTEEVLKSSLSGRQPQ